ncbi:RlmE/FtsJ family methyltransferase [Candidatus Vidania fulgoroideorum]
MIKISNTIYKIIEINKKYIKKSNNTILILGSGKGIWEKYLTSKGNKMYSVDKIYNGRKNFLKTNIFSKIFVFELNFFDKKFDIIISDICCNISGIKEKDHCFFLKLYYKLLEIINIFLKKKGTLIFKFMNFCNITDRFHILNELFDYVKHTKLSSSKRKSSEFYSICKNYKK